MLRDVLVGSLMLLLLGFVAAAAGQDDAAALTAALAQISPQVAPEAEREQLRTMIGRSLREQIAAANRASSEEWSKIRSREDWERYRQEKIACAAEGDRPISSAAEGAAHAGHGPNSGRRILDPEPGL